MSANPAFTIASLSLILIFLLENARFLISVRTIERLDMQRTVSDPNVFVGRSTRVTLRIQNSLSRATGFLFISDMLPPTFKVLSGSPRAILQVGPRETVQLEYVAEALQMGDYDITGVKIVAQDPLGFSRYRLEIPTRSRIVVYPRIRPLSMLRARGVARVRQTSSIGERAMTRSGLGSDFRGIREYNPGDEFKHIAWKVVAKSPRRNLMTKEFEADRSLNVVVAIHATQSMLDGKIGSRKLDWAVESLVALAYVCANEGDRLLLIFDGRSRMLTVPGHGHQRQLVQVLHQAYDLQPSGEESLRSLATAIRRNVRLRSIVLAVTDTELEDVREVDALGGLASLGHQVFLYSIDTCELFGYPSQSDSRTRMGYDVVRSATRQSRALLQEAALSAPIQVRFCAPRDLHSALFRTYLAARKSGVVAV
jgi:uncharacterized protein (DUF58 family)